MSKATISELYWELDAAAYNKSWDDAKDRWDDAKSIEIVPRKIVEMIIKKCKDHASGPRPSDYIVGVSDEAGVIAKYAESLLKEFEEDKDDEDVTCSTQADEKSSEEEPIFGQAFDPD